MKHILVILIGIVICINSCRLPADPLGEITIITRLNTINTGGDCLDLDVDIEDSILVAAANYNGYFIYKINSIEGGITDISVQKHIGADEMDTNLGDNRAQSVTLSKNHNIAFVMDQYDHIWLYKYGQDAIQYDIPNYLEEDCYGSTWLSVAIDDQSDRIGIYTLLKHNAAEDDAGDFLEYSTSLAWTSLNGVDPSNTSSDQREPNCEYIINQGSVAEKIYFADTLLTQSYGELGVRVFKKTEGLQCTVNGESQNIVGSELCNEHLYPQDHLYEGEINYQSCCESIPCIVPNCGSNLEYIDNFGYPGLGGLYSSKGGIIPEVYAEFDTPGEVEIVYSIDQTIFTGLSHSNGCIIAKLNNDGSIIDLHQFAIGYTINGIHQDGGLLALAAGHDGILLYNWDGGSASFIGKIETAYANTVKVAGDIIFAATEDGIEIIQVDY